MRAAPRLQTRSAQACPQHAQAPPRSDFSKKCLSSRSPERPGRARGSLAEPRLSQLGSRDPAPVPHPLPVAPTPRLRPSRCPFPRTRPDRTGPTWAAPARPLTMASLFKKKTVDGEFRARLLAPGDRGLGPRLAAIPGGGPSSAAPQVTVAVSLRLRSLTWAAPPPDGTHPTLVFSSALFPPFQRDCEPSEEAEQRWPLGVVRLGDLMDVLLLSPACLLLHPWRHPTP